MTLKMINACKHIPGGSHTSVSKHEVKHTLFLSADQSKADNSAEAQRQRLLVHLKQFGSLDTVEARRDLDIMHPAGRVQELRKLGVPIQTIWVNAVTKNGKVRRVAQYILVQEN